MPKLGESIMEATVLKWHKQPGDTINMDETLLDIATDKVDSEVPSTVAGVVEEILFNVNDVVPIGTVIAKIRTNAAETASSNPVASAPVRETVTQPDPEAIASGIFEPQTITIPKGSQWDKPQTSNGSSNRFYSPLVLNIAASEGVSMTELEHIPGTGNEGRVTKKDILQYVSGRRPGAGRQGSVDTGSSVNRSEMIIPVSRVEQQESTRPSPGQGRELATYQGNVEIIEMQAYCGAYGKKQAHQSPCYQFYRSRCYQPGVMERQGQKRF